MAKHQLHVVGAVALVGCLGVARMAQADCEANMAPLAKQLETTTDDRVKTRLFLALRRARMELDEFDEIECQQALDAVTKLLQASR